MIFLGSALSCLILGIIGLFIFHTAMEAVIGIIIGCLYVIVDTQIIIFKAQSQIFQPFTDAINLYSDLIKVFVEIVKLLSSEKKESKKK